jgi:hypothetical protein
MEPKAKAVEKDVDWTVADAQRVNALSDRWSKAWATIYQKLKY